MPDPPDVVNVGCGNDLSIGEVAGIIRDAVGYRGRLVFDPSKPDGTPRKLLDISRIRNLGWTPTVDLRTGIARAYADFLESEREGRLRQR